VASREVTGFATEEAAEAFADGVSYVNDSAIEDIEVFRAADGSSFSVTFTDQDADEDRVLVYDPGNM
jgi:hypothetical protein